MENNYKEFSDVVTRHVRHREEYRKSLDERSHYACLSGLFILWTIFDKYETLKKINFNSYNIDVIFFNFELNIIFIGYTFFSFIIFSLLADLSRNIVRSVNWDRIHENSRKIYNENYEKEKTEEISKSMKKNMVYNPLIDINKKICNILFYMRTISIFLGYLISTILLIILK